MTKECSYNGYVAFSEDGKMLNNYWSGGSQTGTNKQTLTDDIEKATIAKTKEELRTYIIWYNNSHKNKVNFKIEKVLFTKNIQLIKIVDYEDKKVLYV